MGRLGANMAKRYKVLLTRFYNYDKAGRDTGRVLGQIKELIRDLALIDDDELKAFVKVVL